MGVLKQSVKSIVPQSVLSKMHTLSSAYNAYKYSGNAVACPFCNKNFSKFLPTGALERAFWNSNEGLMLLEESHINVANAVCPKCGSGERHRLLYFYLHQKLRISDQGNIKVLDVAPDKFLVENIFSGLDVDYVSIDIYPDRNPTMLMDVTDMEFQDNTFDAIICYHVLEHIPNDILAMKELLRVLKPSGWAIIQVPIWAKEQTVEISNAPKKNFEILYGHKDHVRRYGLDFKDRLLSVGWEVLVDDFSRKLAKSLVIKYGLFETEDIYLCAKNNVN